MAACADSCITSPSLPVTVSLPLPSIRMASVVRIWPPTSVQAKPTAAPISFFLSAWRSRNLAGPRRPANFARRFAGDVADSRFQIPHAGFAGVELNQAVKTFVGEFDLLAVDAGLLLL